MRPTIASNIHGAQVTYGKRRDEFSRVALAQKREKAAGKCARKALRHLVWAKERVEVEIKTVPGLKNRASIVEDSAKCVNDTKEKCADARKSTADVEN